MASLPKILGLHHITAIAADAQKNVDFYTGVLGLKLVKINVNQDDPTSLHLYYGDDQASPGSLVTFFIYPGIQQGKAGWNGFDGIVLRAPRGEIHDFNAALERASPRTSWMDQSIVSEGPDGEQVEVVCDLEARPIALGIPNLHVSSAEQLAVTRDFLVDRLGMSVSFERTDMASLTCQPELGSSAPTAAALTWHKTTPRGRPGAGTIHHIAFRVGSDEEQAELHAKLVEAGVNVSPIIDRFYFKSIYFPEPGGVLLEVATDGPGFAVDEPADQLGRKLCLPPWFEKHRATIEAAVPRFTLPTGETIGGR